MLYGLLQSNQVGIVTFTDRFGMTSFTEQYILAKLHEPVSLMEKKFFFCFLMLSLMKIVSHPSPLLVFMETFSPLFFVLGILGSVYVTVSYKLWFCET